MPNALHRIDYWIFVPPFVVKRPIYDEDAQLLVSIWKKKEKKKERKKGEKKKRSMQHLPRGTRSACTTWDSPWHCTRSRRPSPLWCLSDSMWSPSSNWRWARLQSELKKSEWDIHLVCRTCLSQEGIHALTRAQYIAIDRVLDSLLYARSYPRPVFAVVSF